MMSIAARFIVVLSLVRCSETLLQPQQRLGTRFGTQSRGALDSLYGTDKSQAQSPLNLGDTNEEQLPYSGLPLNRNDLLPSTFNVVSASIKSSSTLRSKYNASSAFLIPVILLILQNSGLILFMRYSIIKSNNKRYIISTAVLCSELIKFTISSLLSLVKDVNGSIPGYLDMLFEECVTKREEFMKIIVPSVLYAIQNNLQYVAVANLSAPVFQTMYQLKIVTTAIFSVFLLKRNLLAHQWMSIFTLFLGASAVQLSQQAGSIGGATCNLTGLLTVIVSCFTSGFSGVYFEKTLKNKQAKASIWLRNVQMSFFGILIGMLGCLTNDRSKIAELGFFYGYNGIVWTVIMLQALGGLVVSMVVKHADNLMKGFATSLSIIISCGLSAVLFNDLRVNRIFLLGSTAVVASTIAFGYAPPQKEPKLLATTQ